MDSRGVAMIWYASMVAWELEISLEYEVFTRFYGKL